MDQLKRLLSDMVSADSLHVDILVDIFSLLSPSDLASASLVSKSFNGPAIRQLYHDIHFRAFDLRRWPTVSESVFYLIIYLTSRVGNVSLFNYFNPSGAGSLCSVVWYARHVYNGSCIFLWSMSEITAIPPFRHRLHSEFLRTCTESLSICPNIHTFTFMIQHPALLRILRERKQLYKLQLQFETINPSDAEGLAQITGLHTLALHRAPLNVCLQLSRWASNVSQTLRILIIHVSYIWISIFPTHAFFLLYWFSEYPVPYWRFINRYGQACITTIAQFSYKQLLVNSIRIRSTCGNTFATVRKPWVFYRDVRKSGFFFYKLCWPWLYLPTEQISNLNLDFPKLNLPNLHHLILNIHPDFSNYKPNLSFLLELFFDSISDSSIFSITCKFSNPITFPDQAMLRIIRHFRITLSKLNLVRADMSREVLADLTGSCKNLYQLAITPLRTGDVFVCEKCSFFCAVCFILIILICRVLWYARLLWAQAYIP